MKLTPAILSSWNPDKPLSELIFAKCSGKQISHVDDISACVSLHKLDLSNNEIKKTGALSGLRYCSELTWLNLQNNQLDVCPPFTYQDKDGLGKMDKLLVLNLNLNQVERITPYIYKLKELKALILGHNKITKIENLESLTNLNTLVLSYNKIEEVNNLTCLKSLTKLSITHNRIRVFPDLRMNTELKELRLNNNRLIGIPEYVKFLPKLEILDLGNNLLKEFSDIENLGSLLHLNNLNLKGNPVTKLEGYKEKVLDLIPSLKVLDGERFDKKFLERREKRKIFLEHKKKKEIAKKLGLGKKNKKKNKKANKEENKEKNEEGEDTKEIKNTNKKLNKKNSKSKIAGDDAVEVIEISDDDKEKPKKNTKSNKKKESMENNDNENDVEIIDETPKKNNNNNKFNNKKRLESTEDKKSNSLNKINKNSKLIKKEEHHLRDNNNKYRKTGRSNGYFDYVHEMERVSKEQEESIGNMKRKVTIKEDDFFVEKKTKTKSKKSSKKEDSNSSVGKKKRKSSEIESKTESGVNESVAKAPKLEEKSSPAKAAAVTKENEELEMKTRSGVVEVIDVNASGKGGKSNKGKKGKATKDKVLVTQFNPGLWSAKKSDKSTIVKSNNSDAKDSTKEGSKQNIWGSNIISGWD